MLATHRIISDISFYHFTLIVVIDKNISLKVSSSSIYLLNKIKLVRLFSDLNIRSDLSIFTKIVIITNLKKHNVFEEVLGYRSKFVFCWHSQIKKNVIPHLEN